MVESPFDCAIRSDTETYGFFRCFRFAFGGTFSITTQRLSQQPAVVTGITIDI
eukprot:m.151884 g.151884  ORF g.151884 m.151884 type:complete len:53 (-) comp17875_c0_seq4:250-408(-)